MLIREFSDLHLEFEDYTLPELSTDKQTVLVLAGDIGVGKKPSTYVPFLERASEQFASVVYVFGNHEYYKGSFANTFQKIKEKVEHLDNVHILLRDSFVFNDEIAFVGAPLWTDFDRGNPLTMNRARMVMNDYRLIRNGPPGHPYMKKFTPEDAYRSHVDSKMVLFEQIQTYKEQGYKTVMVVHHAPSRQSIAEQFKGDDLNGAYVSGMDEDLMEVQPDLIFHGHTHASFTYNIGDSKVICNPKGYPGWDHNPEFDPYHVIEL